MVKPKRVLIADDRLGMQSMIREALLPHGFQVEIAENGLAALGKIDSHDFDLVLLDKKMPVLDGLATLFLIKKKKPELPVIIMSAGDEMELKEESEKLGASGYLYKPFNLSMLLAVVNEHTGGAEK